MEIINFNLPEKWSEMPTIITMGSFDGCHLGHQFILKQLNNFYPKGIKMVLTFKIPPKFIFNPGKNNLISNTNQKLDFFQKFGINATIILLKIKPKLHIMNFLICFLKWCLI